MRTEWILIGSIVIFMLLNLWSERRTVCLNGFFFKAAASFSFFFLAFLRWDLRGTYGFWILAALGFCVLGDMLLVFKKTFLPGLCAFLLGHVTFCVAFGQLGSPRQWPLGWLFVFLCWGGLVLAWLWHDLKRMKVPVCFYMGVICTMLWAAVSVRLAGHTFLIPCGAALFAISDLAVARNRFKSPGFVNRAWGLPLYYTAQILLALSVGIR